MAKENDVENDKKIQRLLSEKHELEKKLEQYTLDHRTALEVMEKSKLDLRQEYEDKLHQLQEEKTRSSVVTDRFNKEIGILKDEARSLELERHSLEKRLKDAESAVQVQSSVQETTLQRYTQLSHFIEEVKKQQGLLQKAQLKIEERVIQIIDYIKKLEFCIRHGRCILASLEQDKIRLSEELVKSRSQSLANKSASEVENVAMLNLKLSHLEDDIKKVKEENERIATEACSLNYDKQTLVSALNEANTVTNKYMVQAFTAVTDLEQCQEQCQELQEKLKKQTLKIEQLQEVVQTLSSKEFNESWTQTQEPLIKSEYLPLAFKNGPGKTKEAQDEEDGSLHLGNDLEDVKYIVDKLINSTEMFVASL